MKTWIALLRGINVGGNHILPMKDLVDMLETLGYKNVKTYIQSGNVVFQSPTKPKNISSLIKKKFGFKPAVFMLSADDFKKAADNNPFQREIGKTVHFFFLANEPTSINYDLITSLKAESEEYQIIENVFYLYAPNGIGRSKLVEKIGKCIPDVTITARNLNTITKIVEMMN